MAGNKSQRRRDLAMRREREQQMMERKRIEREQHMMEKEKRERKQPMTVRQLMAAAKTASDGQARQEEAALKKNEYDEAVARALQLQFYHGHGNNILMYVDSLESTFYSPLDPRTESAKEAEEERDEDYDDTDYHYCEYKDEDEDEEDENEDE